MARASRGEAAEEQLVRVNFTPGDVARIRFTLTPAPMLETTEALIELRRAAASGWRDRGRVAPWLREARRTFPATARPLNGGISPANPTAVGLLFKAS